VTYFYIWQHDDCGEAAKQRKAMHLNKHFTTPCACVTLHLNWNDARLVGLFSTSPVRL